MNDTFGDVNEVARSSLDDLTSRGSGFEAHLSRSHIHICVIVTVMMPARWLLGGGPHLADPDSVSCDRLLSNHP